MTVVGWVLRDFRFRVSDVGGCCYVLGCSVGIVGVVAGEIGFSFGFVGFGSVFVKRVFLLGFLGGFYGFF